MRTFAPLLESGAMEIPKIEITFSTAQATKALSRLAQAGLDRPELLKGIAAIEEPLFDSHVRDLDFEREDGRRVEVALTPSAAFSQFLRALETLDGQPAIFRSRE